MGNTSDHIVSTHLTRPSSLIRFEDCSGMIRCGHNVKRKPDSLPERHSWPAKTLVTDDGAMIIMQAAPNEFFIGGSGLTVSFY